MKNCTNFVYHDFLSFILFFRLFSQLFVNLSKYHTFKVLRKTCNLLCYFILSFLVKPRVEIF